MTGTEEVGTGVALQLAGLKLSVWRNAMDHGHSPGAPKTLPHGKRRAWCVNDVVKLRFFAFLTDSGMQVPAASELARQLEIGLLKDPDAAVQGVYVKRLNGLAEFFIRPEPPEGSELMMSLPVGKWRLAIRAELREVWRQKHGAAARA